jgi:hypothetical protein
MSTHVVSFDSASPSEVAISSSSSPGPEYTVILPLPPPAPQFQDGAGKAWSLAPQAGSFPRFPWGSALLVLEITANVTSATPVAPSVTATDANGVRLSTIGAAVQTPNVGALYQVLVSIPINTLGTPSLPSVPSVTLAVTWPPTAQVSGERVRAAGWQPAPVA